MKVAIKDEKGKHLDSDEDLLENKGDFGFVYTKQKEASDKENIMPKSEKSII